MINDIFHLGRPLEVFFGSRDVCVYRNMNFLEDCCSTKCGRIRLAAFAPNIYQGKVLRRGLCRFFTSPGPIYPGNPGKTTVLQGEFSLCRKSIAPDPVFYVFRGLEQCFFCIDTIPCKIGAFFLTFQDNLALEKQKNCIGPAGMFYNPYSLRSFLRNSASETARTRSS